MRQKETEIRDAEGHTDRQRSMTVTHIQGKAGVYSGVWLEGHWPELKTDWPPECSSPVTH